MAMTTTTHLSYRHTARAALEFYQSVFEGEIALVTYRDAHNLQSEEEWPLKTKPTRSYEVRF